MGRVLTWPSRSNGTVSCEQSVPCNLLHALSPLSASSAASASSASLIRYLALLGGLLQIKGVRLGRAAVLQDLGQRGSRCSRSNPGSERRFACSRTSTISSSDSMRLAVVL